MKSTVRITPRKEKSRQRRRLRLEPLTEWQQQLAAKHIRLAYWLARRAWARQEIERVELPELEGEALLYLCAATLYYDPLRGRGDSCFASFACTFIRRRLGHRLHREHRRPRPLSLAELRRDGGQYEPADPREADPTEKPDTGKVVLWLRARVKPSAWRILHLRYVKGLTCAAVADMLGVTRQAVSSMVQGVRARMQQMTNPPWPPR